MASLQGKDSIASEVVSASLGGAFSSMVLYPLEVLKTRIQAEEHDINVHQPKDNDDNNDDDDDGHFKPNTSGSMMSYAHNLYSREGLGVFYKGMAASAMLSALEKACYFCSYTLLKQLAAKSPKKKLSTSSPASLSIGTNLFLGCLAEWSHLPLTLPIDAFTTAVQTQKSTAGPQDTTKTEAALALWMTLWKQKSFYKGIAAYYVLCFKPAIQYALFEQLKASILAVKRRRRNNVRGSTNQLSEHVELTAGEAFFLGMFSRMVSTLIVFPFVRAKVRLQSSIKRDSDDTETTIDASTEKAPSSPSSSKQLTNNTTTLWSLLQQTYKEDGFTALYQGLGPEITRGILSAALMMMAKERIASVVKHALHRDQ
ncbi:MAG: hypothetical protein SGILL_006362 [Bacillariaceae sp.]